MATAALPPAIRFRPFAPPGALPRRLATPMIVALVLAAVVVFAPRATTACAQEAPLTQQERRRIQAAEQARVAAIERVYGAVVAVYGLDRQGGGSGVIVHPAGYALTNHHVVEGAGAGGWGGLADGRMYRWKLIGTDPGGDVAVIRLQGKETFPYAPLGDSDSVRVGDWAIAMGNPFILAEDQRPTATLGVVSGIERFQPEAGGNMLLYGNCIQVDSSINPGNSGGPLFNLRGEVIGINGRGSFQDRGRVNVGLGYAISVNQIKRFLPDLLATKVAQHGVLDAVFADRTGGVLCESINLDAPVASAGLQLGDRLLEFESKPIRTANQFLNLISTLPADWPAQLVLEREGRRFEIFTRLLPLPYEAPPKPPMPMPVPMPAPEEEKIEPPAPEYPQPAPPSPVPRQEVNIENPGQIKDESLCSAIAAELLSDARATFFGDSSKGAEQDVFAVRIVDELRPSQGKKADAAVTVETVIVSDGRFRVERREASRSDVWGFDGGRFWSAPADGSPEILSPLKALREPLVRQATVLSALQGGLDLSQFGKLLLDGADKAQGQPAYRLKLLDAQDDWFYLWLTPQPDGGPRSLMLAKAGPNVDGDGAFPYLMFGDWRPYSGRGQFPFQRTLAAGIREQPVLELSLIRHERIDAPGNEAFAPPESAQEPPATPSP